MIIEQMTARGAVTRADLIKSRKVMDGEDGATIRLQHFQQGDVICSALFLVPAEGDDIEFICAGRAGIWMRDAADDFVQERQRAIEDGVALGSGTICPEDVYQKAVDAKFNLVATPLGMMDFVRKDEDHALTITCSAWAGEDIDQPAAGEAGWTVARVEVDGQDEVGHLQIWEEMAFDRAVSAAALLGSLTVRDQAIEIEFDTVKQMCEILQISEAGHALQVEEEEVEPVDPITPEDHIAAGEDLLRDLDFDFDFEPEPDAPSADLTPGPEMEQDIEYDFQGQAAFRF